MTIVNGEYITTWLIDIGNEIVSINDDYTLAVPNLEAINHHL